MNATEMMETFGNGGYDEDSNEHMIETLSQDNKKRNKHINSELDNNNEQPIVDSNDKEEVYF